MGKGKIFWLAATLALFVLLAPHRLAKAQESSPCRDWMKISNLGTLLRCVQEDIQVLVWQLHDDVLPSYIENGVLDNRALVQAMFAGQIPEGAILTQLLHVQAITRQVLRSDASRLSEDQIASATDLVVAFAARVHQGEFAATEDAPAYVDNLALVVRILEEEYGIKLFDANNMTLLPSERILDSIESYPLEDALRTLEQEYFPLETETAQIEQFPLVAQDERPQGDVFKAPELPRVIADPASPPGLSPHVVAIIAVILLVLLFTKVIRPLALASRKN